MKLERKMPFKFTFLIFFAVLSVACCCGEEKGPSPLEVVLKETQPLKFPRGERLPLFLWTPDYSATADDAELERVIKELDARGISLLARWHAGDVEKTSALPLRIAKIQKK